MTSIKIYLDATEIFKNREGTSGTTISGQTGKIIQYNSHGDIYLWSSTADSVNVVSAGSKPTSIGTWAANWTRYPDTNGQSTGTQTFVIPTFGSFQLPIKFKGDFINYINTTASLSNIFVNQTSSANPNQLYGKTIDVTINFKGSSIIFTVTVL